MQKGVLFMIFLLGVLSINLSFVFGQDNVSTGNEGNATLDNESAMNDTGVNETAVNDTGTNETEGETNESSGDVDNETSNETEIMDNLHGARVRLLQLERAILRRALLGDAVIAVLANRSINTTDLEGIVRELRLLADEAGRAANGSDSNLSVQHFLDIKRDAKVLIKEFRGKVKGLLTGNNRVVLNRRLKEIERQEMRELGERILRELHELNGARVQRILAHMNSENESLVEEVREGKIAVRDVVTRLRAFERDLSDEEKRLLRERLRDERVERRVMRVDRVLRNEGKALTRASDRLRERATQLEGEGFTKASALTSARAERFREAADKVGEARMIVREVRAKRSGGERE